LRDDSRSSSRKRDRDDARARGVAHRVVDDDRDDFARPHRSSVGESSRENDLAMKKSHVRTPDTSRSVTARSPGAGHRLGPTWDRALVISTPDQDLSVRSFCERLALYVGRIVRGSLPRI
jgi:hypothetical protein